MFARVLAGSLVAFAAFAVTAPAQAQRYDNDRESVECRSQDYRRERCPVDWRDARLVRQTSNSACVRGQNWGVDRRGLWVDDGCGGVFVEAGRGRGRGRGPDRDRDGIPDRAEWTPGPDWDRDLRFVCASEDYRYQLCQVDIGRGGRVYIARNISGTRCVEGQNWGSHRAGVWVNEGCAAEFVVERRWR